MFRIKIHHHNNQCKRLGSWVLNNICMMDSRGCKYVQFHFGKNLMGIVISKIRKLIPHLFLMVRINVILHHIQYNIVVQMVNSNLSMKYRIVQICVNEDLKHILKGLTKGIARQTIILDFRLAIVINQICNQYNNWSFKVISINCRLHGKVYINLYQNLKSNLNYIN